MRRRQQCENRELRRMELSISTRGAWLAVRVTDDAGGMRHFIRIIEERTMDRRRQAETQGLAVFRQLIELSRDPTQHERWPPLQVLSNVTISTAFSRKIVQRALNLFEGFARPSMIPDWSKLRICSEALEQLQRPFESDLDHAR